MKYLIIILMIIINVSPIMAEVFELPIENEKTRYCYLPEKYRDSEIVSSKFVKFMEKLISARGLKYKEIKEDLIKNSPNYPHYDERIMDSWLDKPENRRKFNISYFDKLVEFNKEYKKYSSSISSLIALEMLYHECYESENLNGKLSKSFIYINKIKDKIKKRFPKSWQAKYININRRIFSEKEALDEIKQLEFKIFNHRKFEKIDFLNDKERYMVSRYWNPKSRPFKKYLHERNRLIKDIIFMCISVASGRKIKPNGVDKYSSGYYFPKDREYWYKLAEKYCEKYLIEDLDPKMKEDILDLKNNYILESKKMGDNYYKLMLKEKKSIREKYIPNKVEIPLINTRKSRKRKLKNNSKIIKIKPLNKL